MLLPGEAIIRGLSEKRIFFRPMLLKFPHIRLFMRNMLAEGVSCSDTIANTAYEYGLITKEALERVKAVPSDGDCPCMIAARQVLVENFASSAKAEKLKTQVDSVWSTIKARVDKKVLFDSAHGPDGHINGAHGHGGSGHASAAREHDGKVHRCEMAAPAIFDVLLQELSRY